MTDAAVNDVNVGSTSNIDDEMKKEDVAQQLPVATTAVAVVTSAPHLPPPSLPPPPIPTHPSPPIPPSLPEEPQEATHPFPETTAAITTPATTPATPTALPPTTTPVSVSPTVTSTPESSNSNKSLEEAITCPGCKQRFATEAEGRDNGLLPKLLPSCFHTLCVKCIEDLQARDPKVTCPICHNHNGRHVSKGTAKSLTTNFMTLDLIEVSKISRCELCEVSPLPAAKFCGDCGHFLCSVHVTDHQKRKHTASHVLSDLDKIDSKKVHRTTKCNKHLDKDLEVFCENCDKPLCFLCSICDHSGHKILTIGDAGVLHKNCLTSSIEYAHKQNGIVQSSANETKRTIEEVSVEAEQLKKSIDATFDELIAKLQQRRSKLQGVVDRIRTDKTNALTAQLERIQQVNTSITGLCTFAESVVERGSVLNVLDAKSILAMKLRECDQALGPDLHPVEDKHIVFYSEPKADLAARIDSFGKVYSIDIKKCSATGSGLARAILNKKTIFYVTLRSHFDEPITNAAQLISANISKNDGSSSIALTVVEEENGKYRVSFSPEYEGPWKIAIKVQDRELPRSPFYVAMSKACERDYAHIKPKSEIIDKALHTTLSLISSIKHTGKHSNNNEKEIVHVFGGDLWTPSNAPRGLEVDHQKGELFVADNGNHRVIVFKLEDGTIDRDLPLPDEPLGLALDKKEGSVRLYVSCNDGKIRLLNRENGNLIKEFGTFERPWGIAINQAMQQLIVVDYNTRDIHAHTMDGVFISEIGKGTGTEPGKFHGPFGVACNSKGHIFITDGNNHRVQEFGPDGTFVKTFGDRGKGNGQFRSPRGITVDAVDNVLVCDFTNKRVQVFNSKAEFVCAINDGAEPWFVTCNHEDGTFYVSMETPTALRAY